MLTTAQIHNQEYHLKFSKKARSLTAVAVFSVCVLVVFQNCMSPTTAPVQSVTATDTAAALSTLGLSVDGLSPAFDPAVKDYTLSVGFLVAGIRLNPGVTDSSVTITLNGNTISSNTLSDTVSLAEGSSNTLTLVLTKNGNSTTYTINVTRASASSFAQQAYVKASTTEASDRFSMVAISGNTMAVGVLEEDSNATGINGNQSDNSESNSGAVYVFTRSGSTWSQQAYIKASNTGTNDGFGEALDIDGDTLVVGAKSEDSNATGINGNQSDNSRFNAGAVYVFTRSGSTWTQQAYIKGSASDSLDQFGHAVAINGDTLAVSANEEDSNATGVDGNQANNSAATSGAVYVFTRSGTTWSQQAYLKASNTDAGDRFGTDLDISGDTLAVTANSEGSNATGVNGNQSDNSASQAGAVYVFTRSGTTWSQQAYLKASNAGAGDIFGTSVAVDGNTIAVGAMYEDSNATGVNGDETNNSAGSSGAVYVFTRSGTTWSQQAYIKASNTGGNDQFGEKIDLFGNSLVVGAIGESSNATGINGAQGNDSATYSGAAYLFTRSGTTWSQQSYIKASNSEASDFFGYSVAIGADTIVVSSFGEDSNATGVGGNQSDNSVSNAGAVYVLK
jgi:hypothetical protein